MSAQQFEAERARAWGELDAMLRAAQATGRNGSGPAASGGSASSTARPSADLAFVRRRYPGDPLIARLEPLVLRGARHRLRAGRPARVGLELPVARLLAAAGRAAGAAVRRLGAAAGARRCSARVWGLVDAPAAAGLIPAEFQSAADPPVEGRDFDAETASAFSFQVMFNNIQVTLLAFVGGITFGALTVWALFFNGLMLGVIAGLAIGAGNGIAFLRLISSHGPLEISCIVVGGVAGLRIGWALIRPGVLRRGTSLRREARPAVEMAVGTVAVAGAVRVPGGLRDRAGAARRVPGGAGVLPVRRVLGARRVARAAELRARRGPWPADRRRRASRRAGPAAPRARARPAARTCAAARARAASTSPAIVARAAASASGGSAPGGDQRLERRVRRAADHHRVAAREHRDRAHERARRRLLEQVAEDDHERPLGALGAPERELVVAVDRPRLEVEQRPHDVAAALRRGGSAARTSSSNATAPQRSPSSSATNASAAAASSSASRIVMRSSPIGAEDSRPASISSSRSRSCSSRYWLLIGRPSRAVARQLTWRMSSSGS